MRQRRRGTRANRPNMIIGYARERCERSTLCGPLSSAYPPPPPPPSPAAPCRSPTITTRAPKIVCVTLSIVSHGMATSATAATSQKRRAKSEGEERPVRVPRLRTTAALRCPLHAVVSFSSHVSLRNILGFAAFLLFRFYSSYISLSDDDFPSRYGMNHVPKKICVQNTYI